MEKITKNRKPFRHWSFENCMESSIKYNSKKEWQQSIDNVGYQTALRKGWLKQCCEHMPKTIKPKGYWTLERCKKTALKFDTMSQWRNKYLVALTTAKKNGWLEECCVHMSENVIVRKKRKKSKSKRKPSGYWTYEMCKESALKYGTRAEWRKSDEFSALTKSLKNGWMEEFCKHMRTNFSTLEECKKSASNYSTRTKWSRGDNRLYAAAQRYGWINECCEHMD